MFKATALVLSSLTIPVAQDAPIQIPSATRWKFYNRVSEPQPSFPKAKFSIPDSPIRNDDLILQNIEESFYKNIIEDNKD